MKFIRRQFLTYAGATGAGVLTIARLFVEPGMVEFTHHELARHRPRHPSHRLRFLPRGLPLQRPYARRPGEHRRQPPLHAEGIGEYVQGLVSRALPHLYRSRGIGTSILPLRIGARPEVAVFSMWV